jgi:hypothetical protein
LARAKKAEKALSDANKQHIQREQAVTEWLNNMSALAGGEYHAFSLFCRVARSYCRWISCRKNTGYHATDPKDSNAGG